MSDNLKVPKGLIDVGIFISGQQSELNCQVVIDEGLRLSDHLENNDTFLKAFHSDTETFMMINKSLIDVITEKPRG